MRFRVFDFTCFDFVMSVVLGNSNNTALLVSLLHFVSRGYSESRIVKRIVFTSFQSEIRNIGECIFKLSGG